jgi:hypothetical protein
MPKRVRELGLRECFLGEALNARDGDSDAVFDALDAMILTIIDFVATVYEGSDASKNAQKEFKIVARMPRNANGLWCRRAAVLFAIAREPEIAEHVGANDAGYALDLQNRVLPFATPRFVKHLCQAPDSYVTLTLLLSELWRDEPLGNFPLNRRQCV